MMESNQKLAKVLTDLTTWMVNHEDKHNFTETTLQESLKDIFRRLDAIEKRLQ